MRLSCALVLAITVLVSDLRAVDFLRGDVDGSGRIAVSDAIRILLHLFQGDAAAVPCADAADADDSGAIDLADAVHLLSVLFLGGPAPAPPFPACGEDPTEDALGCDQACPPASVYFGREVRADGLFIVMDSSGGMLDSGELARAKAEAGRLIESLPPGTEFGVIFSRADAVVFPADGTPAQSTDGMKALAVEFIRNTMITSGPNCPLAGLLAALEFAENSGGRSAAILYVSEGEGTCRGLDERAYLEEVLETVTATNAGLARIHTFKPFLGGLLAERYMERLAIRNGGVYTRMR